MKLLLCLCLAAMLALPSSAEGSERMPSELFIERAGIEADAGLREKIDAFLKARHINARILGLMDDALVARYAEHLAKDWPISYGELLAEEAAPLPADADLSGIKYLAVLCPQGAAIRSLLADFERGLLYYDEAAPVPEDVCRAAYAGALTPTSAARFQEILKNADPARWPAAAEGDPSVGVSVLAVDLGDGPIRWVAPGAGDVSEDYAEALQALLSVAAEAAKG